MAFSIFIIFSFPDLSSEYVGKTDNLIASFIITNSLNRDGVPHAATIYYLYLKISLSKYFIIQTIVSNKIKLF